MTILYDVRSERQIVGPSHPTMQDTEPGNRPRYARGHLSMEFDAYQIHQKAQIEEETLRFLRKCRRIKRPPQYIRISGAKVFGEVEKLKLFSNFETILLDNQIKVKEKRVKDLKEEAKGVPFLRLPGADRKIIRKN